MNGHEYKCLYESEEFGRDMEPVTERFGAFYSKENTCFRTWAPGADSVSVCLYRTGTDAEEGAGQAGRIAMEPTGNGVYEAVAEGDLHGTYYTYLVEREGGTGECGDPYARACGAGGARSMVVCMAETDPEDWEEDGQWFQQNENTVIYELHVKDFSWHERSGIEPRYRGKYLAFTQGRTNYRGVSTGLDYLKELGISHVHLLPVFDYASVDETGDGTQFNWGYDPMNYNIPEGSYATDCYHGEVRIREFKQMVQALHKAGIAVVMDVVYNHTYACDGAFHVLAPYYYYRQNGDGSFANGSGCGNETASERVMCGKFIRESVCYWAKEYHIDGFRFDLMGLHDTETMNAVRRELDGLSGQKDILVYGEPWTGGESPMAPGYIPAVKNYVGKLDERVAIFHDGTRDAIKGSVFAAEEPGFVNGGKGMEHAVIESWQAWCNRDENGSGTICSPRQVINYVSVHDNFTLWDKLVYTSRREKNFKRYDERLLDQNRMAAAIVFTCMGTPLFQAGEEFARTKGGDGNSYQSSPDVNCLDWRRRKEYQGLVEYYKGLIALRGQVEFYRDKTLAAARRRIRVLREEGRVAAILVDNGGYGGEPRWSELCIICNSNSHSIPFLLPGGYWNKLADKKSAWLWKKELKWSKMRGIIKIKGNETVILGRKDGE